MVKNSEKCGLLVEESEEDNLDMSRAIGRNVSLHKGVARVVILWPDHATTCLQIAILIGAGMLLFVVVLICTATGSTQYRKCALDNTSITPTIHTCIINDTTELQLQFIANLSHTYPNKTIRIIILKKGSVSSYVNKHKSVKKRLDNVIYEDIIDLHANVEFIITDIEEYFQKSILYTSWKKLDDSGVLLACRALAVWNSGGTAIDINLYINQSGNTDSNFNNETNAEKNTTKTEENITVIKAKTIKRRSVGNDELPVKNTTHIINIVPLNKTESRLNKIYDMFQSFKTNLLNHGIQNNSENRLPRTFNKTNNSFIFIPETHTEVALLHGNDGALISAWQPCHALTWEILFSAKLGYKSAVEIIQNALQSFCRGKVAEQCHGLKLV